VLGAAAGCAIGHHEANKHARINHTTTQPGSQSGSSTPSNPSGGNR
jgi:hypothetical protein